jgi:hypothetical protein
MIAYMKAISRRKGCDMRYSDIELYGPRSGIFRHARTEGYSMATLLSKKKELLTIYDLTFLIAE